MADMSQEEMIIKANQLTDESLESTKRMVQMTEESLNVGVKTMTMLDEQGEKLKNVEKEMDQINQDMKQAQKNLNELSKCCGLCLCPFNRLKSTENYWRKKQVKTPKESKQNIVSSQPTVVRDGQAPTGPYIKRITNNDREDEMEDNLRQVGNHVEILKNMALDFDDKIEDHIEKTAKINDKIATITSEVAAAEKQARKHQ